MEKSKNVSNHEISDEELDAIEKRREEAQDPRTCTAASVLLSAADAGRLIKALRSERERSKKVEEAFRALSEGFQALKERSEEAQEALTPFVEMIWLSSERAKAAEERETALWALLDEASCWLYDWLYTGQGAPIEIGPWLRRADELERGPGPTPLEEWP